MKLKGIPQHKFLASFLSAGLLIGPLFSAEPPPREIWSQTSYLSRTDRTNEIHGFGRALAFDSSNNVIQVWSSVTNCFVTKYAGTSGARLWETPSIAGNVWPIQLDGEGNIVVFGQNEVVTNGQKLAEFYSAKLSGISGNLLWEHRQLEDSNPTYSLGNFKLDSSGNSVVTISSTNRTTVTKLSATNGTVLWQHLFSDTSYLFCPIAIGPGGEVVVVSAVSTNLIISKFDGARGGVIWSATHPLFTNSVSAADVAFDVEGNLAVTGSGQTTPSGTRMFTAKFRSGDGELSWINWTSPPQLDQRATGYKIVTLTNGNLVTLGVLGGPGVSAAETTPYVACYLPQDGTELWAGRYAIASLPIITWIDPTELIVDRVDGNLVFGFALSSYSTLSARSKTFKADAATGAVLWELTHTNIYAPNLDYRPDLLAISGQLSRNSAAAKLFRGGPELSAQTTNSGLSISWPEKYLDLQDLPKLKLL